VLLQKIAAYFVLYTVWGSTYYFIKLSVAELDPFTVVGFRFFTGGAILMIYSYFAGYFKNGVPINQIRNSFIIGIFLLIGGNGLVTIAEKKVDSYLAALIVATTPMIVLLYDTMLFKKKVLFTAWIGTVLGIVGVALLLMKDGAYYPSFTIETFLVIGAVVSWGLGTSLSKILSLPVNSTVNGAIQLFSIGILASAYSLIANPAQVAGFGEVSSTAWLSLAYLGIFGSLGLASFSWLLYNEPNSRVVTYAFVNPVIAILIGVLFGHEIPVKWLYPGTVLILIGLFLMFYVKPKTVTK